MSGADSPFSLEFCPRLKRMFESRVVETSDGKTAPFEAGSTVNNIQILRHLVMALRPTRTLEIGLAHGASALTFLTSLREINAGGGDFLHTAIDPFQRTVWKSAALHAIAVDGFRDHFQFHDEESSIALPRLCDEHREFQLIYIDGSHLFEDVFLDFAFTARLLPIGGLCLFDDCSDRHVQKVIRFIKTNYRDVLRRYPLEGLVKKPLLSCWRIVLVSINWPRLRRSLKRRENGTPRLRHSRHSRKSEMYDLTVLWSSTGSLVHAQ